MGAAAGLSAAATGLKAGASIDTAFNNAANQRQQGQQTAEMDEFKATQLQDASQFGMAKASQTDTFLRQKTQTMLGNIMAMDAAANVDPNSPTGNAILARTQGQSDQQRSIQVGNLDAQAAEDASESTTYTDAARDTLNRAYANSSSDIFSGVLGGLGSIAQGLSGIDYKKAGINFG